MRTSLQLNTLEIFSKNIGLSDRSYRHRAACCASDCKSVIISTVCFIFCGNIIRLFLLTKALCQPFGLDRVNLIAIDRFFGLKRFYEVLYINVLLFTTLKIYGIFPSGISDSCQEQVGLIATLCKRHTDRRRTLLNAYAYEGVHNDYVIMKRLAYTGLYSWE